MGGREGGEEAGGVWGLVCLCFCFCLPDRYANRDSLTGRVALRGGRVPVLHPFAEVQVAVRRVGGFVLRPELGGSVGV